MFIVTNNKGKQVIQMLACENKRIKVLFLCTQIYEREVGVHKNQSIFVFHKNVRVKERVV
jgi:hypothetical protein